MQTGRTGYDPKDWPAPVNEALAPLSDQHRLYALAYCTTARFNKRRAAEAAGYASDNPEAQRKQGYRLSTNVDIQKAIDAILTHLALSQQQVLARLADHATVTIDDVLDEVGAFDIGKARENGAIDLVRKVQLDERDILDKEGKVIATERKWRVEMVDPQAALDKLARAHGLYKDGLGLGDRPVKVTIQIGEEGG